MVASAPSSASWAPAMGPATTSARISGIASVSSRECISSNTLWVVEGGHSLKSRTTIPTRGPCALSRITPSIYVSKRFRITIITGRTPYATIKPPLESFPMVTVSAMQPKVECRSDEIHAPIFSCDQSHDSLFYWKIFIFIINHWQLLAS